MRGILNITILIILMISAIILTGNKSFSNDNTTTSMAVANDDTTSYEDTLYVDSLKLDPIDTTGVKINNIFTYMILDNFMADAVYNGLDSAEVNEHILRLDAILVGDLTEYNVLGYTVAMEDTTTYTGVRGYILIEEQTLFTWDLFQMTVYHELGHWFGLDHCTCKDQIMMEYDYPKGLQKVFKKWDKKVETLMKDIEKGYNENMSNFSFPDLDHELFID